MKTKLKTEKNEKKKKKKGHLRYVPINRTL